MIKNGGKILGKTNIFLSYCRADGKIADNIFNYFKDKRDLELHMDVIDLGAWRSIKEYMQSIVDMDYVILLISDSYLKSEYCMYEVLEVMRDRKYREKIFPAVTNLDIYSPFSKIDYVKFWEEKFKKFSRKISEIELQNQGSLNRDLKRYQDIASTIAEFLEVVSDMNNPNIADVNIQIEEKMKEIRVLGLNHKQSVNLFAQLGISQKKFIGKPTDLEINQFIKESYEQIINLFSALCVQCDESYENIQVQVERVDAKTVIFRFYIAGNLVRGLKIFLSSFLGRHETIGVADATTWFGSGNNSWNGMYEAKVVEGELKLYATMSMYNRDQAMTCQEVVADIWKNYVQMYLER